MYFSYMECNYQMYILLNELYIYTYIYIYIYVSSAIFTITRGDLTI